MNDITHELLALLDRIEVDSTDPEIQAIARQRFQIAAEYGYTVTFGEEASSESH